MVTKRRVLVTLLIITLAVTAVSAKVMGRGGFAPVGAGAVVAESVQDDSTRPIQRWQVLTEDELALCPLCDERIDREALIRFQETRLQAREEAVAARQSATMAGRGRTDGRNVSAERRPVSGRQSIAPANTRGRSGR